MDFGLLSSNPISEENVQEDMKVLWLLQRELQEDTKELQEKYQLLSLLSQIKILSRKEHVRKAFGVEGLLSVLRHLRNSKHFTNVAAEAANVILNLCYEKQNVQLVLEDGGTTMLVDFLGSKDEELQANAAGALQSICFQPEGRFQVRSLGAIPPLLHLLDSPSSNVKARAIGTLHNMSSDVHTIRAIRRLGGIKLFVNLLHSDHAQICGSAAGALQNVSREVASRIIIRECQALPLLVNLLSNPEIEVQVSAAGALLNILEPEMNEILLSKEAMEKRRTFIVNNITSLLVASIIQSTYFPTKY